eukprot:TRINITY_DN353_c0_g1_i1.p1 TRINITY_DN353_c0_g1~~TRINITY_DN353_c0_g1_i1.p1  ORF type:complete len:109 (-),score=29.52 TRINITY_DN353_c0_g1_i1:563-889(-)
MPEGELEEGQQCTFSVDDGPKPRAIKVVPGKRAPPDAKKGKKFNPVVEFEPYLESHLQLSDPDDNEKASSSRKLTSEERKQKEKARKNFEEETAIKSKSKEATRRGKK